MNPCGCKFNCNYLDFFLFAYKVEYVEAGFPFPTLEAQVFHVSSFKICGDVKLTHILRESALSVSEITRPYCLNQGYFILCVEYYKCHEKQCNHAYAIVFRI